MDQNAVINLITCPITHEPMTDPVSGSDGQTYERSAIIKCLNLKAESPITRQPMTISELTVNYSIKTLCDKYHNGDFGTPNRNQPIVSQLDLTLDHQISLSTSNEFGMIEFKIKDNNEDNNGNQLVGSDLVLVLDHSGSTNHAVEAQDSEGKKIENGYSILDILKHASKMIVKTLNKDLINRICLIIYDHQVTQLTELLVPTDVNMTTLFTKIESIKPGGQTNLWGGLETAISVLDNREDKTRNGAIMVLTDGLPNIRPARGEVETLKKLRRKKNFTSPIYTFGFGYNLEKDLLYDLSKNGNGGNGHIPDGGLVASVFANFTATILTTVSLNLQLHIKCNEGDIPDNFIIGDYNNFYDSEQCNYTFDIGTIQLQQNRHLIFRNIDKISDLEFRYTYKIGGASLKCEPFKIVTDNLSSVNNNILLNSQFNRCFMVECIRQMINFRKCGEKEKAILLTDTLYQRLVESNCNDKLTKGLIENLIGSASTSGQIKLAIENDFYYNRWGEFYLDQLSRSLNQEMKPNFKDSATCFGGELFDDIVDYASDIFDSLPPPTPSLIDKINQPNNNYRPNYSSSGSSSIQPSTPQPPRMNVYNDPRGGCFDSNSLIKLYDGNFKTLKDLKRGDVVLTFDKEGKETSTSVVCKLERILTNRERELVILPTGLKVTPFHPIRQNSQSNWFFPINQYNSEVIPCESIITLVVKDHHIVIIDGYQCIMLGHNFTEGILKHAYLGTQEVINDMKKMPGWLNGHIILQDNYIEKDQNNMISKIIYTPLLNNIIKV